MTERPSNLPELARVMMRQAQLLKRRGLLAEARGMAQRASELNFMAQAELQTQALHIRHTDR